MFSTFFLVYVVPVEDLSIIGISLDFKYPISLSIIPNICLLPVLNTLVIVYFLDFGLFNIQVPFLALVVFSISSTFILLAVFLSVNILTYSLFSLTTNALTTSDPAFNLISLTPLAFTPSNGI